MRYWYSKQMMLFMLKIPARLGHKQFTVLKIGIQCRKSLKYIFSKEKNISITANLNIKSVKDIKRKAY